jgi:FkbM family methyltransferase
MASFVLSLYRFLFCRPVFYRVNYHLQRLTLRGIGVMNSEGNHITGEQYLFTMLADKQIKTVVDVGANTGGYALDLHRAISTARIHAIEPHPKTFLLLKKNLTGKYAQLYNLGLGDKTGKGTLWDFADDADLKHTQPTSTLASTLKNVIEEFHQQKAQAFSFQITTLDAFAEKEKISTIDFLKIDTEGNELDVLKGAKDLLRKKKIRFIQFEFNEMNVYNRTFFKDFIDMLPGYTFYRLMPTGLYPLGSYKPSTHEIFAFQNILAVPVDEHLES